MCTCIAYQNGCRMFGRNLDLEYSFQERIVFTPRRYAMHFLHEPFLEEHYAILGMAAGIPDFPLYADAVNERGLAMAGLYFPENACYCCPEKNRKNVASFEVIPWLLGQCGDINEVRQLTEGICITNEAYAENLPPAPLHWMVSDQNSSIVIEAVAEGVKIYENPFEILTNNPPFPYHRTRMQEMLGLTSQYPQNRFSEFLKLKPYGEGMGALGLPGDASPSSRFLRAAFLSFHSAAGRDSLTNVSQLFHILEQTGVVRGSVCTREGAYDLTRYSCCIDMEKKIYYFKTYENFQVQAIRLFNEELDAAGLQSYEIYASPQIYFRN